MNILGKQQSKLNMDVGIVIIQLFLEVSLLKRAVLAIGTMVKNIEAGNSFFGGYHARFYTEIEQLHKTFSKAKNLTK